MNPHRLTVISLALAALASAASAQQSSDVGKITVTGEGDKLGTGLMIDDDTPKAKSTVTKAQIDKLRSSGNPYQAMALLPGVNATSQDATGLFGGNLRVRGFNSDQMGFTVNGAPVNDSGNFAVYPQEYSDSENICEMFVTQGATDTEAPHVGASGGNIGLTTCAPNDTAGGKVAFSAGQLNYSRVFVRGDTGKIGNFKGFLSASTTKADKWKGPGQADRNHIDAAVEYKLGNTTFSGSLLWNNAVNNNFRALTLAQLGTEGYFADYTATVPQHQAPVAGTAQTDTAPAGTYYGYSLNPFKNYLLTTKASIQLDPALRIDVAPYYWYGFGNGGPGQNIVRESSGGAFPHLGVADINGDGDTLDSVLIYRASVTETHRPGVTTTVSYTLDNQRILGGVWFERARHRQTQPGSPVDNNGNVADYWLQNPNVLLRYNDGTLYEGRNTLTISTGKSVFVQDSIDLLNSKLTIVPGLSYRAIDRDFTNFAAWNGSTNTAGTAPASVTSAADYQFKKSYSEVLPSISGSYMFAPEVQGFASLSKNFKAPGNFEYFGLATGVTVNNGVGTATGLGALTVQQETSVNLDFGVRYKNEMFKGSATAYYVKFKNRIASGYDFETNSTHDYNVGDSTIKGLELELGTVPYKGFSAYASASYTKSTIDDNIPSNGTGGTYATSGVQFPDTPKGMAALSLQYTYGPLLLNVSGKYTGTRNITLVGDQSLAGYTTYDLNAAYQLPSVSLFKNPIVRFNWSNITDKRFLLANSGSGSSIAINAAGNPSVYGGAPRFASLTLQSDF
jgi:iron complex outermembrane receptor protein